MAKSFYVAVTVATNIVTPPVCTQLHLQLSVDRGQVRARYVTPDGRLPYEPEPPAQGPHRAYWLDVIKAIAVGDSLCEVGPLTQLYFHPWIPPEVDDTDWVQYVKQARIVRC